MPSARLAFLLSFLAIGSACEPRVGSPAVPAVASMDRPLRVSSRAAPAGRQAGELRPQPATRDACAGSSAASAVDLAERMTFGEFWTALAAQVDRLDVSALDGEFAAFAARHEVDPETPGLRGDFTRMRTLFEATRDGGWWRLRWDITDQEPSSVLIWKAWLRTPPQPRFDVATAVAECDEISALFSVAARRLGVRGVGLFYPTWNHVIAGWSPQALGQSRSKVVLVPTTQIFQSCGATFDATTFRSPKQVYEFPRVDVKDSTEMPTSLASFLLQQVRAYGEASPALSALIRAKRADLLQSSLGDCDAYRGELLAQVRQGLSCADQRALRHLAVSELGSELHDDEVLTFLGSP